MKGARLGLEAATLLVVIFLLGPLVVVVAGSFTEAPHVTFPPEGFTLAWYGRLLDRPDFLASFVDSLVIAAVATVAATALGTLAAIGLDRRGGAGAEALRAFAMSPLVLPTVITGVALFQFFRVIELDASLAALVVGHTLITVPYVVRTVGAALVSLDPALGEAAASLGAAPLRILLMVTLPAIAPAMLVSVIFVFIISFDQVTVSIFLSDSSTMPLPIRIYTYIEFAIDPMVAAVSTLLILFAYLLVVVLERLIGLDRVFGRR